MTKTRMRPFLLQREEDVSGTSGTGVVAEGCEFSNGFCAVIWLSALGTYSWYSNVKTITSIHGHEGRTFVVWLDENGNPETP
jgi:hypothetical protein